MAKNTSILLGSHFDDFINAEVASGKYNSVSEVIRTALRLLETEEQKTKHLQRELELGEKSPTNKNFDPKKHLQSLHKKHL
jgi:antitoxin ParD1/3/4